MGMDGQRINLTVSEPVARVVAELAESMGLSRSAMVAQYLVWQLPNLREHLARLRASGGSGAAIRGGSDPSGVSASSAAPAPSTAARASGGSGMSRAERRRLQREERKAGLR